MQDLTLWPDPDGTTRRFLGAWVIATRNQLIHGYVGIDDDVLWSIVQTDIPALLAKSLSDLGIVGCKSIAAVHFSPSF